MILGKRLVTRAVAIAACAGAVLVAVLALGYAVYASLLLVLIPAAAAALTALIAAGAAGLLAWLSVRKDEPEDEPHEPAGLTERAVDLFRTRPIMGTVAGLAAGWIFLRNPALATMVAAAFTERARGRGGRGRSRR